MKQSDERDARHSPDAAPKGARRRPGAEAESEAARRQPASRRAAAKLEEAAGDSEGRERLSHPANASQLARLFGRLQQSHGNSYVQRVVSGLGGREEQASRPSEAKGPEADKGLDASTRSRMEAAFGEDFGDVRVHSDEQSAQAARELGARAFTSGRDLYFNSGEYDPSTREGQELIAHELTHVVQQRGGTRKQQAPSAGTSAESHEEEADRVASDVLSGRPALLSEVARTPAVQLQAQQPQRPAPAPAPTIARHPTVISPTSSPTRVSAAGWFSFTYVYTDVPGARAVTLSLQVPDGVAAVVQDLSGLGSDMTVQNAGGTASRTISVTVMRNMSFRPFIQVELTQAGRTYIINFQFPYEEPRPARPAPARNPPGGK